LAVQICCGSLYSFSIFNTPSDQGIWQPQGYPPGTNTNAFTVAVAFFGYTAAIFGPWISRWGAWYSVRNAMILVPAGWAFACLGTYTKTLWVLYAGFGIFLGSGGAFAYISTCSMIQQHFPEFKASATGFAVMGFGVGSTIWTNVGGTLLNDQGYAVYQVQGIFAAIFLCGIALSWNFMRPVQPGFKSPLIEKYGQEKSVRGCVIRALATNPKNSRNVSLGHSMALWDAMRSFEMFLLTIMVVGQFVAGVVFISSASNMAQNIFGLTAVQGTQVTTYREFNYIDGGHLLAFFPAFSAQRLPVVIISLPFPFFLPPSLAVTVANFLGRVGWGFISDKIGRKTFYLLATSSQAFALGCSIVWIQQGNYNMWLTSFLIVGTMYGGGFGVLPAFVSDLFGPKISGATHGLMLAVWATTSIVGTPIFTSVNAQTQVCKPNTGPNSNPYKTCVYVPSVQGYVTNAQWMTALPTIAFFTLLFLNVRPRDRELRAATGNLRVRLWCLVAVFSCCKTPEQQEREWEDYQEYKLHKEALKKAAAISNSKDVVVVSLRSLQRRLVFRWSTPTASGASSLTSTPSSLP
jgi:MFS family permease